MKGRMPQDATPPFGGGEGETLQLFEALYTVFGSVCLSSLQEQFGQIVRAGLPSYSEFLDADSKGAE